jgi:hypothetical protein
MSYRRPFTLFAIAASVALGASGCASPGDEFFGGGASTPAPVAGGPSDTACFAHVWGIDGQDLASIIQNWMSDNGGMQITQASGEGRQELAVDETGGLTIGGDVTVSFTATLENGQSMIMDQHHTGLMDASWAWDGTEPGNVVISDIHRGDYSVETTLDVDGNVTVADPDEPATELLTESPLQVVSCTSTTLITTQPDAYTLVWTRLR